MDFNLFKTISEANPDILRRDIKKWDKAEFAHVEPFVRQKYWHSNASINVFRVVGTQHPDYIGLTWLEFLEKGKRMRLNLGLFDENPGYYVATEKKEPTMYYQSLDGGDLYVADDGNHRTCIAKAHFYLTGQTVLHGVELRDYRVDWELKRLFDEMGRRIAEHRLPYVVSPHSEAVARDDSAGWMLESYEVRIQLLDTRKQEARLLDIDDAKEFLQSHGRRGFLGRIFHNS